MQVWCIEKKKKELQCAIKKRKKWFPTSVFVGVGLWCMMLQLAVLLQTGAIVGLRYLNLSVR